MYVYKFRDIIIITFKNRHRGYVIGHTKRGIFILVEHYGDLPKELNDEEKHKFVRKERVINGRKEKVYVLRVNKLPQIAQKSLDNYIFLLRKFSKRKKMLFKASRLSMQQLTEILKDKRILFYTGAGISCFAGVPDLKRLINELGIDFNKPVDRFLRTVIIKPGDIILYLFHFFTNLKGKPTPAHSSLKRISAKLNAEIFSENFDGLHQKAGSKVIHNSHPLWKKRINEKWLKGIDVICALGVSRDWDGFLKRYKAHNPNGIIIAINLKPPSYLGKDDIFLRRDLQRAIPQLEKEFNLLKKSHV